MKRRQHSKPSTLFLRRIDGESLSSPTVRSFHTFVRRMAAVAILLGFGTAVTQAAPTIVETRTAASTVLVVVLETQTIEPDNKTGTYDTLDLNPANWRVNGVAAQNVSRWSIPWDEGVVQWNGSVPSYPVTTRHRIYLRMGSALVNNQNYSIITPYGNTSLVFNSRGTFCESIKVNQVGYSTKGTSRFANFGVFMGNGGSMTFASLPYEVINESSGAVVTSGTAVYMGDETVMDPANPSAHSGEHVYRLSLASVPAGGPYFVSVPGAGRSRSFGVGDTYSMNIMKAVMQGMYLHRCGIALTNQFTAYTHAICHTNIYDALSTSPQNEVDVPPGSPPMYVSGGYHDAADFDHTEGHPIISVLMLSFFEAFPSRFVDSQYGIPESGNGIPDFLDEIMWGVRMWEFLQMGNGGVRSGWSTHGHPTYGAHNSANDPLVYGSQYVHPKITAMVAGVFAHASRLIRPYNATRADELLSRAQSAWAYAASVANENEARTCYMYGSLQLYLATGDANYHNIFQSAITRILNGQGECDPSNCTDNCPCGPFTDRREAYEAGNNYYTCQTAHFVSYVLPGVPNPNPTLVQSLKDRILWHADNGSFMGPHPENEPYPQGVTKYLGWGSGTAQGRYAECAIYGTVLTTDPVKLQKYTNAVSQYADFPLGLNAMNMSYYTGLGIDQPVSPLDCNSYFTKYGVTDGVTRKPDGTLDNFRTNGVPIGNVPGICIYGPADGRSETSYQWAVSQKLYPVWDSLPPQRRFGHGHTLVNQNEFTVAETMAWNIPMYAFLATPGNPPPTLAATLFSCTQINLSWTDPGSNETGFTIQRKTGAGGTWGDIQTVGPNVTTWNNPNLTANTTYFYRVRANYASGNSDWSNEASATTAAPAAPSSLIATAVSASQINLNWTDNANNETGFKIERKTEAGGTYSQIATVGAGVASYPDTGLANNTSYYYRVRAYNGCADSAYSNEANATTATSSTNITAQQPSVAMTIDGNLSESSWSINNAVTRQIIGTNNNTVTFGVLWDCTYLYVGARVLDGSLLNDSPETWYDDSIEIYIDANHNKGTSYDSFDRQIVKGYGDGTIWVNGNQTAGILHGSAPITGGYSVEVAIPWSNLGITPSAGTIIGFDVGSNDDDNGGVRESQVMWSGTVNNWTDTSPYGNVTLAGTSCSEEFPNDANTIALYHFTGSYNDSSGHGYTLTPSGSVTLFNNPGWMQTPSGQAVRFGNIGDKLSISTIPDSAVQPGPSQTPLSIEARFYARGYKAYSVANAPIIELYQDWDSQLMWFDNMWPASGQPIGPTVNGDTWTVIVTASQWQSNVSLNAWHKFKLTFAADGTAKCYVDDNLIGNVATSVLVGRTTPWRITLGNFDGDIDEVRFSNIVR